MPERLNQGLGWFITKNKLAKPPNYVPTQEQNYKTVYK
jgi:hypothetical protein